MKKELWIKIGHVDNRMVIFLNGETIWDSGIIHNDPELHKAVEITHLLNPLENYANELIFEGFNDTFNENGRPEDLNPWHFSYRVVCRTIDDDGRMLDETDVIHPYDEKHMSNPNIRALNNAYVLKRRNGDYRVVSNALSQQFAE
jgi:hypothetical protein